MFRLVPRLTAQRPLPAAAAAALIVVLTAAVAWLWAHEGHQPLPTKGAQVDTAKGQITLSRAAREALDVQTAEVELRPVAERVLAYATLQAPWQRHAYATTRLPGRITELHAKPGQTIAAGQLLAEVNSLELENLALELVNAQNELELSARIVADLEAGSQRGAVREQHLLEEQTKHQQYQNNLEVARSKWLSLGLTREDLD